MSKLVKLARAGELAAAREVFDRCLGRPRQDTGDILGVELPAFESTADLVAASSAIAKALSDGQVTATEARQLAEVLEVAGRMHEIHALEERIAKLEEANRASAG